MEENLLIADEWGACIDPKIADEKLSDTMPRSWGGASEGRPCPGLD